MKEIAIAIFERWAVKQAVKKIYKSFSHDLTVAMLQCKTVKRRPCRCIKKIAVGIELFPDVKTLICSNKFAELLAAWVEMIYTPNTFC